MSDQIRKPLINDSFGTTSSSGISEESEDFTGNVENLTQSKVSRIQIIVFLFAIFGCVVISGFFVFFVFLLLSTKNRSKIISDLHDFGYSFKKSSQWMSNLNLGKNEFIHYKNRKIGCNIEIAKMNDPYFEESAGVPERLEEMPKSDPSFTCVGYCIVSVEIKNYNLGLDEDIGIFCDDVVQFRDGQRLGITIHSGTEGLNEEELLDAAREIFIEKALHPACQSGSKLLLEKSGIEISLCSGRGVGNSYGINAGCEKRI